MHIKIVHITQEASDVGSSVENLHHTSRWKPYRKIEVGWLDIHDGVIESLTKLSDLPLLLDTLPDTRSKKYAYDLIAAYKVSLQKIIDYTSVALYLERSENDVSKNLQPQVLNFGVSKAEIPATNNAIARNHFLSRFLIIDNARRSLTIPERHFTAICHVTPWN
jgi:hypothetical protein